MGDKLQELSVLAKVAPYLEDVIHAKYRKLESDYVTMVEELVKQKYKGIISGRISTSRAEELSRPIKDECNQYYGSRAERKKWEEEEIAQLHNVICARAYELFPELVYTKDKNGN